MPFVQFRKREKHSVGVLLLVKFQAEACNFTKSNTRPWAFFRFFKLYRWYQIAQTIPNVSKFILMKWAHLEFDVVLDTWYLVRECSTTNHFLQTFKLTFPNFFYILHSQDWAITSLKPLRFHSFFLESKVFTEVVWTERRLKNHMQKRPFRGVLKNSLTEKYRKIYKKTPAIESFS